GPGGFARATIDYARAAARAPGGAAGGTGKPTNGTARSSGTTTNSRERAHNSTQTRPIARGIISQPAWSWNNRWATSASQTSIATPFELIRAMFTARAIGIVLSTTTAR